MESKLRLNLGVIFFGIGVYIALNFSYNQLSPVFKRFNIIPEIIKSAVEQRKYDCRSEECVTCISGVNNSSGAIVFTGGSTFRYGLDLGKLSENMNRPIVNCIQNDSRVDTFTTFFSHTKNTQADQLIIHGYNSWAVNSGGTWAQAPSGGINSLFTLNSSLGENSFSESQKKQPFERMVAKLSNLLFYYKTYGVIFLEREMTESPNRWRLNLSAHQKVYKDFNLKFFPLSEKLHKERKLRLMKKWFVISTWTKSFVINMNKVANSSDIISRHDNFIAAVEPSKKIIFLTAPELTEVFPERIKNVSKASKRIMTNALEAQVNVRHLEVDYQACGLTSSDFWVWSIMIFDPAHPNESAREKITKCISNKLSSTEIDGFIQGK